MEVKLTYIDVGKKMDNSISECQTVPKFYFHGAAVGARKYKPLQLTQPLIADVRTHCNVEPFCSNANCVDQTGKSV